MAQRGTAIVGWGVLIEGAGSLGRRPSDGSDQPAQRGSQIPPRPDRIEMVGGGDFIPLGRADAHPGLVSVAVAALDAVHEPNRLRPGWGRHGHGWL
jgi:hypothetical protein